MVKPRHDIAVLLKNTQNIAIFDPCNKACCTLEQLFNYSGRDFS
ncbi:hypothetical protein [Rickettsia endosymbiont of Aspidapion aeneum]